MTDNPLVTAVIDWYRFDHRDFPWRDPDVTPWGILVSEVMSHQTQMSRVTPRWLEFMRRWPTPAAAAQASDAEILRVWDRLGYPRRALALRQCALAIVERHDGEVPADREALQALPGIGPYTSAAVCSFAFGMRVPVVDTNVRRVIARAVHGDEVAWRPNARRDEAEMLALLPRVDADVQPWNAGAMELGATVCSQRSPDCVRCPIAEICEWRGAGVPVASRFRARAAAASATKVCRQQSSASRPCDGDRARFAWRFCHRSALESHPAGDRFLCPGRFGAACSRTRTASGSCRDASCRGDAAAARRLDLAAGRAGTIGGQGTQKAAPRKRRVPRSLN